MSSIGANASEISQSVGPLPLDNAFWQFSCEIYRRPAVAEACLALQDEAAIDVNVLLFTIWLSINDRMLSASDSRSATGRVAGWHRHVVTPLRSSRRFLRIPTAQDRQLAVFRADVKQLELASEQIEQAQLFDWTKRNGRNRSGRSVPARESIELADNIEAILSESNVGSQHRAAIVAVFAVALPGINAPEP
jgi:uncharacterized protein (TIGR02444 family)